MAGYAGSYLNYSVFFNILELYSFSKHDKLLMFEKLQAVENIRAIVERDKNKTVKDFKAKHNKNKKRK